jgi:hypothetical protein
VLDSILQSSWQQGSRDHSSRSRLQVSLLLQILPLLSRLLVIPLRYLRAVRILAVVEDDDDDATAAAVVAVVVVAAADAA